MALALGRAQCLDAHTAELEPGAGKRRQPADVVVHAGSRLRPIDAGLVLGDLGGITDAGLRLRRERKRAALQRGNRPQHPVGADPRQRAVQSPAVMSAVIATRSAIPKSLAMAPVSRPSSICMMVTPLSLSPAMMARLIGCLLYTSDA